MTLDEIICLVVEADGVEGVEEDGSMFVEFSEQQLKTFTALVAAAEREACAKVCEEKKSKYEERASKPDNARDIDPEVARIAKMTCDFNAVAIRARGE